MGCSGSRGGNSRLPLATISAISLGPTGRYSVVVSIPDALLYLSCKPSGTFPAAPALLPVKSTHEERRTTDAGVPGWVVPGVRGPFREASKPRLRLLSTALEQRRKS